MDALIHSFQRDTQRALYLSISHLEFWISVGKIDVSVLEDQARKALLKSGIQK